MHVTFIVEKLNRDRYRATDPYQYEGETHAVFPQRHGFRATPGDFWIKDCARPIWYAQSDDPPFDSELGCRRATPKPMRVSKILQGILNSTRIGTGRPGIGNNLCSYPHRSVRCRQQSLFLLPGSWSNLSYVSRNVWWYSWCYTLTVFQKVQTAEHNTTCPSRILRRPWEDNNGGAPERLETR